MARPGDVTTPCPFDTPEFKAMHTPPDADMPGCRRRGHQGSRPESLLLQEMHGDLPEPSSPTWTHLLLTVPYYNPLYDRPGSTLAVPLKPVPLISSAPCHMMMTCDDRSAWRWFLDGPEIGLSPRGKGSFSHSCRGHSNNAW